MKRSLLAGWILPVMMSILSGCMTTQDESPFYGNYKAAESGWFVILHKDGNFTYSFHEPIEGGQQPIVGGFCDFDVPDIHKPKITTHANYMQDKFSFVFSPDGKQLAVMLLLSDKNPVVEKYGRQMLLYRQNDNEITRNKY